MTHKSKYLAPSFCQYPLQPGDKVVAYWRDVDCVRCLKAYAIHMSTRQRAHREGTNFKKDDDSTA